MNRCLLLAMVCLTAAACAPAPGSQATPSAAPEAQGVVVTFRVADAEEYKVRLTEQADIDIVRALLAGQEAPTIPNGRVIRGEADVNEGYSWHIDPNDIDFADMAMEVCDGRPSDVEQEIITSDRYCPWSAVVVAIEE